MAFPDRKTVDVLLTTLLFAAVLGIIYLAIAVSKLRADIAHLQGRLEQRDRDEQARQQT